jgi:glycosyltransferase involved in cell wall biosynthesis
MNQSSNPLVSVVVIGRNEGQRLVRCLQSVKASDYPNLELIYVDSNSADGSPQQAAALGARVMVVRSSRPSAALGRNLGWHAARGSFVLFLDGDTQLHPQFIQRAMQVFQHEQVAVVWGHRREVATEQSWYVRVLDLDWVYPVGTSLFCGGDALMRRHVLEQMNGFDGTLIAGEEPELCRRIRQHGYQIQHIDAPMTGHDLAIRSFSAYWKRAFRAGHAYAELANRYKHSADPLWLGDARRNLVHGSGLLALPLVLPWLTAALWPPLLIAALLLLLRTTYRCRWKSPSFATRFAYAVHSHFQQIPILCGQLSYQRDRWLGRRRGLIEYKAS